MPAPGPADSSDAVGTVEVRLGARLLPADVRNLCEAVAELLSAAPARHLVCTVVEPVDLGIVDAVAQLHLLTRRLGGSLRIRSSTDLAQLLVLAGLDGILAELREPVGQPEPGEERGIEEVVDVRHPTA